MRGVDDLEPLHEARVGLNGDVVPTRIQQLGLLIVLAALVAYVLVRVW